MANLFLHWSEADETGISVIDEQHRAIMGIINSFFFHREDKDIERFLVPTVETMKAFGLIHFRTEEDLMRASSFPGLEAHAEEHQRVREDLWAIEYECRQCRDSMGFLFHLKDYWKNHVHGMDLEYIEHLRGWLGDKA